MACKSLHVESVVLFMSAGAPDLSGDVDALHRELIKSGDRSRRQVLNSCKFTTAFRRETNPKCMLVQTHGTESDEAQMSDVQADKVKGGPPRRRLASSGMHALGKLLASDAAVLAKGAPSQLAIHKDDARHSPHGSSLKPRRTPGPLSTPNQTDQISFRKQRGRGRFTGKGDGPSQAHMVRNTCSNSVCTSAHVFRTASVEQGPRYCRITMSTGKCELHCLATPIRFRQAKFSSTAQQPGPAVDIFVVSLIILAY